MKISEIIPPHKVTDTKKLEKLVAAYASDKDVTPVVAIDFGYCVRAITGSHRLAAIAEVFEPWADHDGLAIILDGADLYEKASRALRVELDNISDFSTVCDLIVRECLVDSRTASAMIGQ